MILLCMIGKSDNDRVSTFTIPHASQDSFQIKSSEINRIPFKFSHTNIQAMNFKILLYVQKS